MMNFGPLAAEIISLVWGTPANFNGFCFLAALLHGTLVVGFSQTAAFGRGRHLCSTGRPSLWAFAHISSFQCFTCLLIDINVPVVTCHASKQSSAMALKGDYKPSRLNALMYQRLVARNTCVSTINDDHRSITSVRYTNYSPVFQHLPEPNRACLVGVW